MMDRESIEGLLESLDKSIVKYTRKYETLDKHFKDENDHVLSTEFDEYKERKDEIAEQYTAETLNILQRLDALCKTVRKSQPVLDEITVPQMNRNGRFPRRMALGKLHVQYKNIDLYVPQMFEFPFKKPMYICDTDQCELIHKIVLRLLYALPMDKQEYYIFDPVGLGKNMYRFNRLFANETIFPHGKVMTDMNELKHTLKDVMEYVRNLYSDTFQLQYDCLDWDSFNRRMYSRNRQSAMLPYKIFIFMDVPEGMD
ncbi:MAG: hypothetical protein LUH14_10720 [Clostridiaceae bacterium]|nr:hypothetical protein [Clostridiaceae bacterium]